jgi:hypothetical protein
MPEMRTSLPELLARRGPALTSDLAVELQASGLSPAAARKRLSRLPENVRVLYGLPFPKRSRFIYLEDDFGSHRYWNALIAAAEKASPAYAAALAGLQAHGGVVPLALYEVVCGSPFRQKKQLSSERVLKRLESASLVERQNFEPLGECVCLRGRHLLTPGEIAEVRARLLTESILLDAIRAWAVRMNFTSAGKTRIRGASEAPQFSTFKFDMCGPSFIGPLRRRKGDAITGGFFVADVVVGTVLSEAEVFPFLRKCELLFNLKRLSPFMAMLIADGFTTEALRACRAKGIVATTPASLFGDDAARALASLYDTLTNAASVAASHPERLEELFTQLSKVEGAALNLRGALFELIVGHMVRSVEGGSIDIGVILHDFASGDRAEVDVRLVKEKLVTIYECRGYQPDAHVTKDDVEKWLHKSVPTAYRALRGEQRFQASTIRFELWTSGLLDPETVALLSAARDKTTKYQIAWRDGSAVREYANLMSAPGIRKILDEHYFNHPLAPKKLEPKKKKTAASVSVMTLDEALNVA